MANPKQLAAQTGRSEISLPRLRNYEENISAINTTKSSRLHFSSVRQGSRTKNLSRRTTRIIWAVEDTRTNKIIESRQCIFSDNAQHRIAILQ